MTDRSEPGVVPDLASPPRAHADAQHAGVSIRPLKFLVARLAQEGHDTAALFGDLGLTPSILFEPDARLPTAAVVGIWERASALAGRDVGLRALSLLPPVFGMLRFETEYLVMQALISAPTVREGLRRMTRFYPVGYGPDSQVVLDEPPDGGLEIHLMPPGGDAAPPALVEYTLGLIVVAATFASDGRIVVSGARFRHPPPESDALHRELLGAPVEFAAPTNAFFLPSTSADQPIPSADEKVARAVERRAERLLAKIAGETRWDEVVRALVDSSLETAAPTVQNVARRLGMSPRTLARRLKERGVSFGKILDDVRAAHARQYLQQRPDLGLSEIAHLVGYTDVSAFRRAFRRWFDQTPIALRRAAGEDGSTD